MQKSSDIQPNCGFKPRKLEGQIVLFLGLISWRNRSGSGLMAAGILAQGVQVDVGSAPGDFTAGLDDKMGSGTTVALGQGGCN
jgi:hypothetical protein